MAVVRAFIAAHADALLNASHLLGGTPARRRYEALIGEIRDGTKLTRRMRQGLVDLHALLTLQHVGDPDRIETACFAEIDPADPVVEDICCLAASLHDLLGEIARGTKQDDLPAAGALAA
ncbi:hypothetical protein [Rhodovulum sp. ES.010]|uniref:hypothetical protein n=1 Tax=Rhodovulum sp. ES.010 TaxID=1882821 RepID=UPI00094108EB|nr:hypothetical protein [Rhodovulum sp. ES.010]